MVELEKKYEIGVRRFGFVNWIGVWTLYKKETSKIFKCLDPNTFFAINFVLIIFACSFFGHR